MNPTPPAAHSTAVVQTTIVTDEVIAADPVETRVMRLGDGWVTLDSGTGAPLQFTHALDPERTYLLDSSFPWHSLEHAWGSGHVITEAGSGRWNAPSEVYFDDDKVVARHLVGDALALDVERRGGTTYTETYRFRNTGQTVMRITSLGIQTPFADVYPGAHDALTRRVHAHIFTGGSWAWAAAQPMNGEGHILGLILTEGALWGYSVESRNANTISNARGHLILNATDHARSPEAFGGQPVLELAPGQDFTISWELAWYPDFETLIRSSNAPASFTSFSATTGTPISISSEVAIEAESGLQVSAAEGGAAITATDPGTYWVRVGRDARTQVLFHETVEATVRKRCQYVLDFQRAGERPGLLANALVPVDTRTKLTQTTNGWSDWSDGSERIGIAIMLQHALARGWVDPDVDSVLNGWGQFARRHLIDDTAAPRRGSQDQHSGIRLYDAPWLARFFLLRHQFSARPADLELAARLIERAVELGIGKYLTIGMSEVTVAVADALSASRQDDRAARMREAILRSARYFTSLGTDLPSHEVSYEQSMVAPLLNVLIEAHRITGDPALLTEIRARLPWLLAFGAPLPHARLHGISIRHWDGYWFGQNRLWGDVFPHYWSTLTANVLLRLPDELRTASTDKLADDILRSNMANYFADGSATCAFVMPTSVDGQAAHTPDPLANDQDFHLAMWMQLDTDGVGHLC